MRFSDQTIRSLPHPEQGQKEYSDDAVPGLSIVVGTRTKSFVLSMGSRGARKKHTLGRYAPPHFTLAIAREKARDLIAEHRLGKVEVPRTTFGEAAQLYDRLHLPSLRFSSARDIRRTLNVRCERLRRFALAEITRREIAPILDDIADTPAEMGAAFRQLRAFFRWCVTRGYLDTVPTDRMAEPKRVESRSRVLTPNELTKIWAALPESDYGTIIKLCILSGQRRGQWAACRREYIQDGFVVWPRTAMKAAREHVLPLTPAIRALLPDRIGYLFPTAGGMPFNNWAACKARLDRLSQVENWRHHDLRRTWSTVAAEELGIEPHYIESVLAHVAGTPVARVYNRARYIEPMRKALLAFENWLQALLSTTESIDARGLSDLRSAGA